MTTGAAPEEAATPEADEELPAAGACTPGGSAVSRSQPGATVGPGQVAGNPAVVSGVSQQPAQQSHTMKFHSNAYTANSTPGDFLGKNMVHHF